MAGARQVLLDIDVNLGLRLNMNKMQTQMRHVKMKRLFNIDVLPR